jgi:phage FluMu protein Com
MEGSSFVAPIRHERGHVLRCTECGNLYLSHEPGDFAEQLCNRCFEAALAPASEAHEQLLAEERHHAHLVAA